MTEQEKRIKIAEACGWKLYNTDLWTPPEDGAFAVGVDSLPDYFHDLNACHEMEKTLTGEQRFDYDLELTNVVFKNQHIVNCGWRLLHATAAQRAEAFGLTLSLWT